MSEQYVAAIDQGTTSTRCMIFNHDGRVVDGRPEGARADLPAGRLGRAQRDGDLGQHPRGHRAARWPRPTSTRRDIAAVGITNQRETALVWDRTTGEPVYNAIVWQDTRTDAICQQLGGAGRRRRPVQGEGRACRWPPTSRARRCAGSSTTSTARGRRREAGNLVFGNMDTWVHLERDRWSRRRAAHHRPDERLAHDADGPRHPVLGRGHRRARWASRCRCCRRSGRARRCTARSASAGCCTACRSPGDLGDQQAATFGQACLSVGEAKNTYGTGNFMLINTGTQKVPSKNGLLTTVCYKIGDQATVYALEGSIAVTGSAGAVGARQPGPDRLGPGDRDAGQDGRGQRRRLLRAGVLGPVRAVLAGRRARRDRRADPVRQQGSPRPRGAGGHGLPEHARCSTR